MNTFSALCLVLISLVTACVWSPNIPTKQIPSKDVIENEVPQVILTEFDIEDGHTKIIISPQQSHHQLSVLDRKNYISAAKEKVNEASHVLPNMETLEEGD